jgi:hypothetical protein
MEKKMEKSEVKGNMPKKIYMCLYVEEKKKNV